MCKDNTITTSWSWIGAFIVPFFIIGGFIVASLGTHLTWGEIMIIPFILTFFLNKKCCYCFTDSGFTVKWMFRKHFVSAEKIKQIDVLETKSGTWIIVEVNGAPAITSTVDRKAIFSYCLRNHRKSFLISLQGGERDKALEILRRCYPHKIVIKS